MGVRLHQPAQCNAFGGTVYSRHLPGQGDPGDQLVQPDEIACDLCNAHKLTESRATFQHEIAFQVGPLLCPCSPQGDM